MVSRPPLQECSAGQSMPQGDRMPQELPPSGVCALQRRRERSQGSNTAAVARPRGTNQEDPRRAKRGGRACNEA